MNSLNTLTARHWKDGEKVYVVEVAYENGVLVPTKITENVYLDNPGYYAYIFDRVFLTMEDARKGFASECDRVQKVVERKIASERRTIEETEHRIEKLRMLGEIVGQRKNSI